MRKEKSDPAESSRNMEEKRWETSKDDVRFSKIAEDEEANRRRKRPRSYAIVELAPRECQCEILTTLHTRFLEKFQSKRGNYEKEEKQGLSEIKLQMTGIIRKLSRLEQLSQDLRKMMEDRSSDAIVTIKCCDGDIFCQRNILKHRTNLMKSNPAITHVDVTENKEIVRLWLTFVFTAQIDWNLEQKEAVKQLAMIYGPVGLVELINQENGSYRGELKKEEEIGKETEVMEKKEESIEEMDNIFMSDDPLIGFKQRSSSESPELVAMKLDDIDSPSKINPEQYDSFDNFLPTSSTQDDFPIDQRIPADTTKTPITKMLDRQCEKKTKFGSNVRIMKTSNITPMPNFETMDESELKERMKGIGQRPRGKKKMIEILKLAYNTLHPRIHPETPTLRPFVEESEENNKAIQKVNRRVCSVVSLSERFEASAAQMEDENTEDDGDKTLNTSNDDLEIAKICGDAIEDDEELNTGENWNNKRNDIDGLRAAFLEWMRLEENFELHNHILSLHPVSLEEMLVRLGKADGPVAIIGKAKLAQILDSLSITYQLPQKGGSKRMVKRRN